MLVSTIVGFSFTNPNAKTSNKPQNTSTQKQNPTAKENQNHTPKIQKNPTNIQTNQKLSLLA